MRISDWSSDVCSSDLPDQIILTSGPRNGLCLTLLALQAAGGRALIEDPGCPVMRKGLNLAGVEAVPVPVGDRKSVVEGKSVSVRVDLGGGRMIKKKKSSKDDIRKTITINEAQTKHYHQKIETL